jgi:UDP-N-acetylmuramate dehydrogenase
MINIQKNIPLKDKTTFQIGGPAKFWVSVQRLKELKEALKWAQEQGEEVFVLGGGSNVLFSDKGFGGLVISLENQFLEIPTNFNNDPNLDKADEVLVRCGAGLSLARLVVKTAEQGLEGLEWAAGVPGTVGGAVRGNAGCFGSEMVDIVTEVKVWNSVTGDRELFSKKEAQFDYRTSLFKKRPELIVWEILFKLKPGKPSEIKEKIKSISQRRKASHPPLGLFPSAGSVFQNPKVSTKIQKHFETDTGKKIQMPHKGQVPAWWLIEAAGLKGQKIGAAQVSEKQANFIVNTGGATAEEVIMLIGTIKVRVREEFEVELKEEVELAGF